MSDLSATERRLLERQLGMGSGYVLDFSNRTFAEFVLEAIHVDPYDAKYSDLGDSKANRLRAIWKVEPNHVVGKLMTEMLGLCRPAAADADYERCLEIAARLKQSAPIDVEAISTEDGGREFELLARDVHAAIARREPEVGLDRLHTYTVKFLRGVASRRGILADRDKPLHSVFGEYVKAIRGAGLVETDMTDRILKASISTFEAFNRIRNERSLAHDNPTLGFDESVFIFNHVCGVIRFVRALEDRERMRNEQARVVAAPTTAGTDDDIPF